MPVATLPPVVDLVQAPSHKLNQQEVSAALGRLRTALPNTRFIDAWPADLPGFIAVRLESGEVAYTDKSGRYLILGLVFDTAAGVALDRQLDGHH